MIKVLDLFCCKGGSAKGILNAIPDAEIIGVDKVLNHQEDYPGKFVWLDIRLLEEVHPELLKWADFIWASPPCQAYTYASKKASLKAFRDAMQIHWTKDKKAITPAVPPKYSEYIMRNYLQQKKRG